MRSSSWTWAILGPVALVMLSVSASYSVDALGASLAPVRAARTRSSSEGPGRGVIVRGVATREETLTTPTGEEGVAAWVGRAGRDFSTDGRTSFEVYCRLAMVDGLVVVREGDGQRLTLEGWNESGTFALREAPEGDGKSTLDLGLGSLGRLPVPDDVRGWCPSLPEDVSYEEGSVSAGQPIEVSGCLDEGRLSPCGDAIDAVTTRRVEQLVDESRKSAGGTQLLAVLIAAFPLLVLAAIASGSLPKTDRTREPAP